MPDSAVLGMGIDLVENDRMRAMLDRWGAKLRNRLFLASEQEYCESKAAPYHHYAARFAVKEAVSKAFGTGMGAHITWRDVEVVRDGASGAPSIRLLAGARKLADERGIETVLVSLSHTRKYSVAQALLIGH